jgi:predicted DNA-binding transcriptional regulator YafY
MRADRLLSIMMTLQARKKMTTWELAETLEVSRRTILRDIEALSSAGVPVYTEGGHGGGVMLDENYRTSLTGLKEPEVRALFLSQNTGLLEDLGMGEAARNMMPKLFASLPSLHQQAVDHLRQRIYLDPTWWVAEGRGSKGFLNEVLQALSEDRRIEVLYQHRDGHQITRLLEPYSLIAKADLWYLIARREGEFRTYRMSRFQEIHLLEERFERVADFDPAAYWHENIGQFVDSLYQYTFTLRIHASRLDYIRWYTLGRFEITDPVDETGWFTARFETETIEPAKMLVFGLGCDAVIIEPQELGELVRAQSASLLNQ